MISWLRTIWQKEGNNILIYALLAFTMLITNPSSQFFTIYQRDLGLELANVGLIAAAAALFDLLGRFSAGVFSDRQGRKKPLLFLVLASVLFPFLLIFVRSTTGLLIARVLEAIVNASFWTVIIAYLYDTNAKHKAGRVYSKALMALFIVNMISPLLGGFIIEKLGYTWLFSLSCYIAIIPLIIVFFLKKPVMKKQTLSVQGEVKDIIEKPQFIKIWTMMLLVAFTSSFLSTFFPIFLREEIGLSYGQVGLFFSAGTVVLFIVQPILGLLADTIKSKIIIPANLLLMGVGLVLLSFFSSVLLIFLTKALVPIGIFGSRIKGAANVAKMTPNEEHALAQALFKSSSGIGWAIMNVVSPTLILAIGYVGVFRALSVLSALAGIWYYFASFKKNEEGTRKDMKKHHHFTFSHTHLFEKHK